MKSILLTVAIAACLCAGCSTVPEGKVSLGPVEISNPKDINMHGFYATSNGTNFTVKIDDYKSEQNVEVVKAVVEANVKQAQMALDAAKAALSALAGAK